VAVPQSVTIPPPARYAEGSLQQVQRVGDRGNCRVPLQPGECSTIRETMPPPVRFFFASRNLRYLKSWDKQCIATSFSNLGLVDYNQGDYTLARSLYEESLEIYKGLGDSEARHLPQQPGNVK